MQPINDFMTAAVISVNAETTVEEAAKLMTEKNISSILVKKGDDYAGIITKMDLVKKIIVEGRDPKTTPSGTIMSQPLITKDQYVQRSEANEFMLRKKIKHLAVTQGKKVVGVLTLSDMVS